MDINKSLQHNFGYTDSVSELPNDMYICGLLTGDYPFSSVVKVAGNFDAQEVYRIFKDIVDVGFTFSARNGEWLRFYFSRAAKADTDRINVIGTASVSDEGVSLTLAARSEKILNAFEEEAKEVIPINTISEDTDLVPIAFWAATKNGARSNQRDIVSNTWADIGRNYVPSTGDTIAKLFDIHPPIDTGRIILWHGEPGTGKSTALRSLAKNWFSWCDSSYIMDPEQFFGDANYMMSVLLNKVNSNNVYEFYEEEPFEKDTTKKYIPKDSKYILQGQDRWHLLIIEDADEFLRTDAKDRTGQSLSRLLNLADGLLGQGLNFLVLITTNEPLENIHKAVKREGRCLSNIEFLPFGKPQAADWLSMPSHELPVIDGQITYTLAQLYDIQNTSKQIASKPTELINVGTYL